MKKNEQYFPYEFNMINKSNVSELIETWGPKGFGTYIMVLTELRHHPNYRCSMSAIKGMARRCKVGNILLNEVINKFQLFNVGEGEDADMISSPYLDRVMQAYDEKHRKLSEAAAKRANKRKRNEEGQFADSMGALEEKRGEEKRGEENKTTTVVVVVVTDDDDNNAPLEFKTWQEYFDQAMTDEYWLESIAMNSGMSRLFVKYREEVIDRFRRHIIGQGKETNMQSVKDVKSYFANFMRQGKPTQKQMAEWLEKRETENHSNRPNRFETIDPVTGERTYFGNPIPAEAPPRPNDNAVWSRELEQWV